MYFKNLMARKNWTADHLRTLIDEFVNTTYDVTVAEFMEAKP